MTELETTEEVRDTQPEVEPETETKETDETQELLDQVVPDLAGSWDELSPDKQRDVLLRRLAAKQREDATAKDGVHKEPSADETQESGQPPVGDIPTFDPNQAIDRLAKAVEEADSDGVREAMGKWMGWMSEVVNTASAAVSEGKKERAELYKKVQGVTRPTELRAVMSKVRDATEGDIPAALKLLENGDATTAEAAMKLSVFNRKDEIAEAQGTKRSASDEATRKAQALAANQQRGSSRKSGETVDTHIPAKFTSDEGEALMKKAYEESRAK